MNIAEDLLIKAGTLLPLMEAFYSIQGEGFHTGKSAYFLRIGGCDNQGSHRRSNTHS